MSDEPILLESERTPDWKQLVRAAEAAAVSSIANATDQPILIDTGAKCEIWLAPTTEPPHNVTIELKVKVWGSERTVSGFATRRFCNGTLTFWVRDGGRLRFVSPIGWRAAA